jgi:hypothetical protein
VIEVILLGGGTTWVNAALIVGLTPSRTKDRPALDLPQDDGTVIHFDAEVARNFTLIALWNGAYVESSEPVAAIRQRMTSVGFVNWASA